MDERPRLAEAFRKLGDGHGPIWVTWQGQRFLLALPDRQWLAHGHGPAIIATRRGYRVVEFTGRAADGGFILSKKGAPKKQPLRIASDYFQPVAEKRIRAVILSAHDC